MVIESSLLHLWVVRLKVWYQDESTYVETRDRAKRESLKCRHNSKSREGEEEGTIPAMRHLGFPVVPFTISSHQTFACSVFRNPDGLSLWEAAFASQSLLECRHRSHYYHTCASSYGLLSHGGLAGGSPAHRSMLSLLKAHYLRVMGHVLPRMHQLDTKWR